jgi:hypothetical protein
MDYNIQMSQMQQAACAEECGFMVRNEMWGVAFMTFLAMRKLVEACGEDEEKFTAALEKFPEVPGAKTPPKKGKTAPAGTKRSVAKHRMPGDTADLSTGPCGGCSVQ